MQAPAPSRFLVAPRLPVVTLFRTLLICGLILLGVAQRSFALGQAQFVRFTSAKGCFVIAESNKTAKIYVDSADWPGVVRATNYLQADIARVTALTPAVTHDAARTGANVIIVGTIGHSALIDQLIAAGTIETGKGSRCTGGMGGLRPTPSAAESVIDALANPSSTSTVASPVRIAMQTTGTRPRYQPHSETGMKKKTKNRKWDPARYAI